MLDYDALAATRPQKLRFQKIIDEVAKYGGLVGMTLVGEVWRERGDQNGD